MARYRRQPSTGRAQGGGIGRGLFKFFVFVFALVGFLGSVIGAYQYKKISALYSFANVLATSDRADINLHLNRQLMTDQNFTEEDVRTTASQALHELGINAKVTTRFTDQD